MNFKVHIVVMQFLAEFLPASKADIDSHGWYKWTHESVFSLDLYCPPICIELNKISPGDCCFKYAKPYWSFKTDQVGLLSVEYTNRHGTSIILDENLSNFELYEVTHQNGIMTAFPTNICHFPLIVSIDFSMNEIRELSDISCLENVDELNLAQNNIIYIRNNTFSRLRKLRKLVLRGNKIRYLEPRSLLIQPGSLMLIDLSWNDLETIDVTNAIFEKYFGKLDYSHNKVSKLTNILDWRCCAQSPVHGGFVDFSYNDLKYFFNLSDIGFSRAFPPAILVTYYGLNIRNNQWSCDCLFLPFLEKAMKFYDSYPKLEYQYKGKCASPSHLTNYSITDFRKNNGYDLLICNLTMAKKCPSDCYCYHQPSRNRTVVKCIRPVKSTKSPYWNIMPDFDNLEIDLSNNGIDVLWKFDYFKRVTKLNMSNNSLSVLNFSMFDDDKLTEFIVFDNPITYIDKGIQNFSVCAVRLGRVNIKCNCESIWLKPWLLKQHICDFRNTIICHTEDGVINALDIDIDRLCAVTKGVIWLYILLFAFLAAVVSMSFIIWTKYRYELYLIYRSMLKPKRNKVDTILHYDAYFSFDGENVELRLWTAKILLRYLESKGYKAFYPLRDCNLGQPREEDICRKINMSSTYIVFLSHSYLHCRHPKIEWKYIWHSFRANRSKEIIIINYDDLCIADIDDDRINAFLRLGYALEFFNISKTLLFDIEKRIRRRPGTRNTGLENRLVKFCSPRTEKVEIIL